MCNRGRRLAPSVRVASPHERVPAIVITGHSNRLIDVNPHDPNLERDECTAAIIVARGQGVYRFERCLTVCMEICGLGDVREPLQRGRLTHTTESIASRVR